MKNTIASLAEYSFIKNNFGIPYKATSEVFVIAGRNVEVIRFAQATPSKALIEAVVEITNGNHCVFFARYTAADGNGHLVHCGRASNDSPLFTTEVLDCLIKVMDVFNICEGNPIIDEDKAIALAKEEAMNAILDLFTQVLTLADGAHLPANLFDEPKENKYEMFFVVGKCPCCGEPILSRAGIFTESEVNEMAAFITVDVVLFLIK